MQESKEKISSRMIKNASRVWGFPDTQAASSFDPFVGMILGALSNEMAKISNDINSVESRVLEKLVELLTPEPITGPFPAHAIFRAKSVEPFFKLDPFYQFYINKRFVIPGEHSADEKPVFF
ncbi:MAG: type VI secretion system baseplate subunit TssF, partial [Bacteroidetes bacterium]|nr:type VI secretion system baseplate subunit TssF [Bacteroidota bacterium]